MVPVMLDCSAGSGLVIGPKTPCGKGHIIAQILPNSVADRSGCIQKGDRLLSINKLYNLDATVIRQILGDHTAGGNSAAASSQYQNTHWVEIEIEFDMADSVIPSSGVFSVKLPKLNVSGVGITVNATNHGTFVISEVKPGSPAHRTGSLRSGDILLAVDAHTLQHFNIDALLKDNTSDFTTLTIKRNSLPDFLFDAQQRCNTIYGNTNGSGGLSGSTTAPGESIYGFKSKLSGNVGLETYKAKSCQPEFYGCSEEGIRQSTAVGHQLRRPFLTKAGSEGSNGGGTGLRRNVENTQSLTTEADDQCCDGDDQNGGDFHLRYQRYVL